MTRLLLVAAVALAGYIAARCSGGCYCERDRFAWRCVRCGHLC